MDDQADAELGAIVRGQASRHAAPAGLQQRIVTALRASPGATPTPVAPAIPFVKPRWQQWLPLATAFACGVFAAVGVAFFQFNEYEEDLLSQEVVSSHVRSLMASHLADVASSDQHTVKPWFAGKLDFSPPVFDLAAEGFPLAGGRLDYLGQRPVAALVYRHGGHWINVFVWPAPGSSPGALFHPSPSLARQGYHLAGWNSGGMQFWAVSDINAADLQALAKLLQARGAQ